MDTIGGKALGLELVLGGGWISRHEASLLAEGAVIRSDRMAGTGQELHISGTRMADGEALVVDSGGRRLLCVQVSTLEAGEVIPPEPERGEELTELLPFRILMGDARASLDDLAGLGEGSVIDLGIDADAGENGFLEILGQKAAAGKILVIGENMGLRLTRIMGRTASGAAFRTTGNLLPADYAAEKVAVYDFSRPDFFTRRQIEGLESVHLEFLRSLAAASGGAYEDARLVMVDQLNFQEFLESLPAEGGSLVVAPCPGGRKPEFSMPAKPLRRLAGGDFPEAEVVSRTKEWRSRPSGGAVLAAGKAIGDGKDSLFTALRDAWKRRGGLSPYPADAIRAKKGEYAEAFRPYADRYEMIAIAEFDLGASGKLSIVYPARTLEPVMKALSR
jgi:flagellar motor switch/type III secretory pathway protein FliN